MITIKRRGLQPDDPLTPAPRPHLTRSRPSPRRRTQSTTGGSEPAPPSRGPGGAGRQPAPREPRARPRRSVAPAAAGHQDGEVWRTRSGIISLGASGCPHKPLVELGDTTREQGPIGMIVAAAITQLPRPAARDDHRAGRQSRRRPDPGPLALPGAA